MEEAGTKNDGPVLGVFHRKLRALKKKSKRITEIEQAKTAGKAINAEQEDVLKSKPSVQLLIDEYEKLHDSIVDALKEEAEVIKKDVEAELASKSAAKEPDSSNAEDSGDGSSKLGRESALRSILQVIYVGNPLQLDEETEDVNAIRSFASLLLGGDGGSERHGSHKEAVEGALRHALALLDGSDSIVNESLGFSCECMNSCS